MNRILYFLKTAVVIAIVLIATDTIFASTPAPPPPVEMINLVQGKSYTITPLVSIEYSFASGEANYYFPGALTDGLIAPSTAYSETQWQGYTRGGARSVVIDMGQINTVHQMQERFLHYPSAGIYFPRRVTYSLSMNGSDWSVVGSVNSSISLTSTDIVVQTYAVSNLNYQARYVKMTFTVDVNVFADEFQVFGDSGIVGNATIPQITPLPVYPNTYCQPGSPEVGGTKDMVLIPNGYYKANPTLGQVTADQLTPYVGYVQTSGKITDFMFDSFLFSPFGGAPSGGTYGASLTAPTVMSDWIYYLDNTFDPVYNLSALNTATSNVKGILNAPNYKVKVEVAIPYPNPTATNFGDVDGDGISENMTYLPDREKALKWYVDQVMSRWNAANYQNMELVGFYWVSEQAAFTIDDSESTMLRYIANYIVGRGKVLNWIPYKDASGFAEWNTLGFDGAWMQPNYAFHNYPEQELAETADACKKLGMGIEIEIHWNALTDSTYRTNYYKYLDYGVIKGYMTGAAHTYYQNSGPGTYYSCSKSTNPVLRNIYDQTYNFIKGTYQPEVTGTNNVPSVVPAKFGLSNNYPNPFNPSTTIKISLVKSDNVSLKIYNMLGQLVKIVDEGFKSSGEYKYNVNMDNFTSGVYFYTLQQGENMMTKKMILLK